MEECNSVQYEEQPRQIRFRQNAFQLRKRQFISLFRLNTELATYLVGQHFAELRKAFRKSVESIAARDYSRLSSWGSRFAARLDIIIRTRIISINNIHFLAPWHR